jgi:hypothetical protein
MTFKEFRASYYEKILPHKPSYIRDGQALFNYLSKVWPDEADRIVGDDISGRSLQTNVDCFYVDSKIDALLTHLEKEWHNYPY